MFWLTGACSLDLYGGQLRMRANTTHEPKGAASNTHLA